MTTKNGKGTHYTIVGEDSTPVYYIPSTMMTAPRDGVYEATYETINKKLQ